MKRVLFARICGLAMLFTGCMVCVGQSLGSSPASGIAFFRASHLKRGINLSMWYAQASDYSAARLTTYTTAEDFRLVKSLGFDHARLSISPEPLMVGGKPDALDAEAIARLDKTVADITATGLIVILDIHPEMPYVEALGQSDDSVAKFLTFWKTFATHYAKSSPVQVYFEVLNEPHMQDSYRWFGIQSKAMAVIRAANPRHTIIATGNRWGGLEGLLELEPVRDSNVIYSFHDYDPMTFTHQGATWSSGYLKSLKNVPYPSTLEDVATLVSMTTDEEAKKRLTVYGQERWDANRMDAEIGKAAAWGREHAVPVWCGEFGVYKKYAQPGARAKWLHDMHVSLEAHGIPWSMWDYQGSFALVDKSGGRTTADTEMIKALGLKLLEEQHSGGVN